MESKRLRPDYEWVELSARYRAIGIGEAGTGGQKQLTWLTAPECLHRDGVTCNAESTLPARRRRALPQPPQGRPAHVRYTAVGPDIGQLTRGSRGSKRAGRVAEGKAQVTHSLAGTYDRIRTKVVGDRDREQTAACSESSACGNWSIGPRSARIKSD